MANSGNSIGLGTILFVVFLILKLTNVIAWSWWWVTAPIWIPVGFWLFILLLCIIFFPKEFKAGMWKWLNE
jgi:hypothetical protein